MRLERQGSFSGSNILVDFFDEKGNIVLHEEIDTSFERDQDIHPLEFLYRLVDRPPSEEALKIKELLSRF